MQTDYAQGFLYDPRDERDACGVGFVADLSRNANHGVLETAIVALKNLEHRGAVGADGRSGDGAGVLTQLPLRFISREVERLGFQKPPETDIAAGMFFLPRDEAAAASCRQITEATLIEHGFAIFGWRLLPVDERVIGARALSTSPRIEQVLIGRGNHPQHDFESTLRSVRRQIESQTTHLSGFYISSLSSRTVVYKGMFIANQLDRFYRDLTDPLFETSLAVLHQRYSTNTFPNWA